MDENTKKKIEEAARKKELFIAYAITAIIAVVIGVFVFLLCFLLKGADLIAAIDGATYSGVFLFAAAILMLLARLGAFDTFAYGFKQLGAIMFSKNPTKYNDMAEYKQQKYEARQKSGKYYIPVLIISVIFFVAVLVLYIIFSVVTGK